MKAILTVILIILAIFCGSFFYPILRNMKIYGMNPAIATLAQIVDQTRWAPGYSEIGFVAVRPGMEPGDVDVRLGQPLKVEELGEGIAWHYTAGPHGGTRSSASGSTHVRAIVFDGEMRVRAKARYFCFD